MAYQVSQINHGDYAVQISGDVELHVTFEAAATLALALALGGHFKKQSCIQSHPV